MSVPLSLTSHAIPFALSAFVNLIACAPLGVYLLTRSKKDAALRLFALYNLCAALWSLFYLLWQLSGNEATATVFTRLLMAFATFLPLLYFLFVEKFLNREVPRIAQGILWFLFGSFALRCLVTPSIVGGIAPRGGFPFWPVAGPLLAPLLSLWFATVLLTLFLLARAASDATTPRRRGQMLALLAGNILAYAGGATNFFLWYNIPVTPWGNSLVLAVPLATMYAIAAHRLFDLRLFIRRTVVFTGLLSAVVLVYSVITFLITRFLGLGTHQSTREQLVSLAATVFVGLSISPLKSRMDDWTDRTLFRKEREQRTILQTLANDLNQRDDLNEAFAAILRRLTATFQLDHAAAVLLPQPQSGSTPTKLHIQEVGYSSPRRQGEEDIHALCDCFEVEERSEHRTLFVRSLLVRQVEQEEMRLPRHQGRLSQHALREYYATHTRYALKKIAAEALERLDAEVAVPLRQGGRLIGVLLLSSKREDIPFTPEELSLIDLVSGQAISAIQKAQLFEGDRQKGEFVSLASHELLTPISAMAGYLSMILEDGQGHVDEQGRGYLRNVDKSVKRLLAMTKDLLSVSRIESGSMPFSPESVDLVKLVEDAIAQLRFTAKDKGLDLRFNSPTGIPPVWVDPERTMQVVINLLSNAIKYTPSGSVTVSISYRSRFVRLSVKDTGLGMSSEAMSRLFQKFSRIATAETASIPGTGLGLYITKSIVEKMGGMISVTSSPGKGSEFTVAFSIGQSS